VQWIGFPMRITLLQQVRKLSRIIEFHPQSFVLSSAAASTTAPLDLVFLNEIRESLRRRVSPRVAITRFSHSMLFSISPLTRDYLLCRRTNVNDCRGASVIRFDEF